MEKSIELLSKALSKHDHDALKKILMCTPKKTVEKLIKILPENLVISLLSNIGTLMEMTSDNNDVYIVWVLTLCLTHGRMIHSCDNKEIILGPVLRVINKRKRDAELITRLKGKLQYIGAQINPQVEVTDNDNDDSLVGDASVLSSFSDYKSESDDSAVECTNGDMHSDSD